MTSGKFATFVTHDTRMKTHIEIDGKHYETNLSHPIDISLPLRDSVDNPIAWYLDKPVITPVTVGEWVGKVSEGSSSTNFNNIFFNPHGHGTHTECLGHITAGFFSVNHSLRHFFFLAELVSITPEARGEDGVITVAQVRNALADRKPQAVVIRTLPNRVEKQHRNYSHTNPPYMEAEAAAFLRDLGVEHLLVDLPSVDREEDEGKLLAHKAFWNVKDVWALNDDARHKATITELIFVDDTIADGTYLLNLQIASFENDATPSKPVLYPLTQI